MNTRKRRASESLLPIRAAKYPRTSREGPNGGNPSPSQFEGILSRWITLAKDALRLSRETFSHIMEELGAKHVQTPPPPSPTSSPSPTRDSPPKNVPGFAQNITPRMRKAAPGIMGSPSHPCYIDHQMTIDPNAMSPLSTTSTTESMSTPCPSDLRDSLPAQHRRIARRSVGPPPLSSPPHRTDSFLAKQRKMAQRSVGPSPPSSPSCHTSNVMFPPTTSHSISLSLGVKGMPPHMDEVPTAGYQTKSDSSNVHRGPIPTQIQGSMGPPPSFPHRTDSGSTLGRNIIAPPSTATMSASTLSSLPSSSDIRNSHPRLGEILAASRHRIKSTFPDGIPRRYQNREHIFAKTHKTHVQEVRRKDRDEMVKELFRLRRNTGYISDFATFQNWLDYGARLDQLEKKGALSPSPSLIDLRSRAATPTPNRRHSLPEDINSDFLERTLEKARQALNGPKPPKPFIPSLDQLWLSARAKDEAIEQRLRLPTSLPPEDEAKVDALLNKRGVVSKHAREQVTDKDMSRLKPCQWLNDEIINFYGSMILGRSDECKENPGFNGVGAGGNKKKPLNVHYFSTFFWSKLKGEGYDKARLAKWTKKFDLFQKDVVLIPVNHHNSHWTGAAINFRRKRIESYDSMGVDRSNVYKLLRSYIDAEHRNKKKKPFDFSGWEDYTLQDTPQQENGYDCGVFTCQFLEALSRGEESFNFTQTNMPYLRRRMIWEIGNATLRDD